MFRKMAKHCRSIFYVLAFLMIFVSLFVYAKEYRFLYVKEYLFALLSISGMMFTILGIWIAFLYPSAIYRISNPSTIESADFSDSLDDTRRLEALVLGVLRSVFVAAVIMLAFAVRAFLGVMGVDVVADYANALIYSILFMLGAVQVETIGYVVVSNVMFVNDLHKKRDSKVEDQDV